MTERKNVLILLRRDQERLIYPVMDINDALLGKYQFS